MKEILRRGATSNILRVFLQDSASTTGAGKTALTSASSGLIISTIADLEATATTYTSAATNVETITTLGTFAAPTAGKCRFREVDATNFPGVYEIHIADARFNVANATQLLISIQCTGVAPVYVEYQFVAVDLMDTVRFGLTALPNTAVTTNGSLITAGTGTAQLSTTSGVALANTTQWNGVTVTGMPMPTYTQPTGFLAATFPTTVASTTNITGGTITTVSGNVNGSVGSVTGNVGGNVTGSVGSLTATAVQNIWDDATTNNTVVGSVGKLIVDNLNATVSSRSTLTAADVWNSLTSGLTTVGSAGKLLVDNLNATVSSRSTLTDTQVWSSATRTLTAGTNIVLAKGTGITGFNDITASTVWSEALPGSYTSGQAGFKLNAAGTAADPWATTLPGSYAAGTAGNIIGNQLDAAVSSRMATFTYTTPPTAASIATQVWSEPIPGSFGAGTAGAKLNSASSAGDPWATTLPGSYSVNTAGYILGTNLNATVSSRSTLAATDVWSATTRTLSAGTNIVLTKGTGITGFNDITAQSVWDVLASAVSVTGSMGLQLKTNVDAQISTRLASSSYTAPLTTAGTAQAVWNAATASYAVSNTFGERILRSSSTQATVAVTGSNHVAADIHELQPAVISAGDFADSALVIGSASGAGVKAYLDSTADEGIADAMLNRNIAGGGNGTGATTDRTVRSALRTLRNKSAIVGTTLTVYAEDDTATAWTATVSSSATADPVTGIDPA